LPRFEVAPAFQNPVPDFNGTPHSLNRFLLS
jgi:hypothetical protein